MDVNDQLNAIEQQPMTIYTQISFCYPLTEDVLQSTIITTLTKGLERLTENFSWIAGQVVCEGASDGKPGIYRIKPFEKTPRLIVKDLQQDPSASTWEDMRQARFSFGVLDENVFAPRNTIPGTDREPWDTPGMPVFLVQANFVKGGLVLTFNGQHQAMDMIGQGVVIDLYAKACRNEPFTPKELMDGNPTRRDMIPLFDESWTPGPELDRQIVQPSPSVPDDAASKTTEPCPVTWAYFLFSAEALAALKADASRDLPPGVEFISTDDALCALIWQSILRARSSRLTPEKTISFGRAVDVRRYFKISPNYPGMFQNMVYHSYPLQELIDAPLSMIAANLREAVDPKTCKLEYNTRSFVTALSRLEDKNKLSYTATLNLEVDVVLSSWVKLNCYDLDFGLGLGKPEAVRRPAFIPCEGLLYLIPKSLNGEIGAGLCLKNEDLENLKRDKDFTRYGVFIG